VQEVWSIVVRSHVGLGFFVAWIAGAWRAEREHE
jgi:hypothetical protein